MIVLGLNSSQWLKLVSALFCSNRQLQHIACGCTSPPVPSAEAKLSNWSGSSISSLPWMTFWLLAKPSIHSWPGINNPQLLSWGPRTQCHKDARQSHQLPTRSQLPGPTPAWEAGVLPPNPSPEKVCSPCLAYFNCLFGEWGKRLPSSRWEMACQSPQPSDVPGIFSEMQPCLSSSILPS